jgi:cellulose synthase/poly-beta-1,6-N-acetylglucosamine synthase-like glycosyltransferase
MSLTAQLFADAALALNLAAALALSFYAVTQGVLLALYARSRWRRGKPGAAGLALPPRPGSGCASAELPAVTVQVPVYNERYLAQRMIAALAALDYPRDRLRAQILDDSTDDTTRIAQCAAEAARAAGLDIELIHRPHRAGYKAGALADGLRSVTSEFIAVFDADFVPPPDFLRRIFDAPDGGRLFDRPEVAFIQTRWGYLNREDGILTRAQALLLDMHFVIDQRARSDAGWLMNFNGSGGVWRRAGIEAAGGWQTDTLTEDLDLSYRAQLLGWRGVYLPDQVSPSELPDTVLAFKRQQARWARGTMQCMRKLLPRIARTPLKPPVKLAALAHLSGYLTYPMLFLLALLSPLIALGAQAGRPAPGWMSLVGVMGLLPMLSMLAAHQSQGRSVGQFARDFPAAMLLGIGLSLSNSVAMAAGLIRPGSGVFVRTPKRDAGPGGLQAAGPGRGVDWTAWAELGMAGYVFAMGALLARNAGWLPLLPLALYGFSFAAVSLSQLAPLLRRGKRAGLESST